MKIILKHKYKINLVQNLEKMRPFLTIKELIHRLHPTSTPRTTRLSSYIRFPICGGRRENAEGIVVRIGAELEEVRNVKKTTKANPNKVELMKITQSCKISLTVPVRIARQQATKLNKRKPAKWSKL